MAIRELLMVVWQMFLRWMWCVVHLWILLIQMTDVSDYPIIRLWIIPEMCKMVTRWLPCYLMKSIRQVITLLEICFLNGRFWKDWGWKVISMLQWHCMIIMVGMDARLLRTGDIKRLNRIPSMKVVIWKVFMVMDAWNCGHHGHIV